MGSRSQGFARALEQRGAIPAASDVAGAPLGEILAQAGEIREDPLNRALRALNGGLARQGGGTFVDEGGYERDLDSGAIVDRATASPTERPIDAATLSAAELAALLPDSKAAEVLPYATRALSPAEKEAAFQESGASRTRAGQRNALAKEPNAGFTESARAVYPGTTLLRNRGAGGADADDRYTWFTPGGVLGAGMEPSTRAATLPLLVAPASQERPDAIGRFQAPSVHLKSAGGFVPGLADARILDINPFAQLSPAAAAALEARLGESFYARTEPDKSETGGYAGRATNAPIPDPATGAGGFDPIYDPATSRRGTMASDRPMTVAEAVSRIATRNLAPISPVMLNQLTDAGEVVITPPVGEVFTREAYPLGMPSADEVDLSPVDRLRLQAQKQGTDWVDARIGSRGRYGPGLYPDLDALVGVLAGEAFPDARARYQLQATASDLATRAPITVSDRYRPLAIERPVGADWSLLVNSPNRDGLVPRYQQELLSRAGLELPAGRNPLLALVGELQAMSGTPVADVPAQAAAPAAQRAAREPAALERALQQAKTRARSSVRGQLVPSETGSGTFAPDTSAYERKSYEENARTVLAGLLDGRIPAEVATAAMSPQRVVSSAVNPNAWIDERPTGRASDAEVLSSVDDGEDPYSRSAGDRYTRRRAAQRATPATALARPIGTQEVLLPAENGELRPYRIANQASIPGLQVPYSSRLYSPDPVDEVAQYMARQAKERARARLDEQYGGLRVVGPDPVYQQPLPSSLLPRPGVAGRGVRR